LICRLGSGIATILSTAGPRVAHVAYGIRDGAQKFVGEFNKLTKAMNAIQQAVVH
jgi:hypothetical protein